MANPFSGLENIGQSYLQGVQLANQRQAREEAAAQRAEETRMRGQYYQDLVDQRREAAALAATGRDEGLAIKFGRFLKRNRDGSIDIVGSATAQEEGGNKDQLLETAGFAETSGIEMGGITLSDEDRKSKSYLKGKVQGIIQKATNDQQMARIMASQGILPGGDSAGVPIPPDLESTISGAPRDNTFGIMGGGSEPIMTTLDVLGEGISQDNVPQMMAQAPTRTAPAQTIPEGYTRGVINGKNVLVRKPKAEKAEKPVFPGEIEIETPRGPMKIKLTAEQVASELAQQKSAQSTNAPVKARFQRDPVTGKLVLAK
jgi:hypothetical protein